MRTWELGRTRGTPSKVVSEVSNKSSRATTPPLPPMSTASPTSNGRNTSRTTPEARSLKVSLRARPTAKPAAPRTARKLVVSTPSCPTAATSARTLMAIRVTLPSKGASVGPARSSLRRCTVAPTQAPKIQPTATIKSAATPLMMLLRTSFPCGPSRRLLIVSMTRRYPPGPSEPAGRRDGAGRVFSAAARQ